MLAGVDSRRRAYLGLRHSGNAPPSCAVISSAFRRTTSPRWAIRSLEMRAVGPDIDIAAIASPNSSNTSPATQRSPKACSSSSMAKSALARQREFVAQRRPVDNGLFRHPPHGLALKRLGEVAVRRRAEERLADARAIERHARPRAGECAHHLPALDLREIDRFVFVLDREIHGFRTLVHQSPHIGAGDADQIARPQEGGAGHERLHAHGPEPTLMIEMHVALLLQGGEQPVSGRWRQSHAFGDMSERHALVGRGELVDDAQRPHQRLDMVGPRPRGLRAIPRLQIRAGASADGPCLALSSHSPIQAVIRWRRQAPELDFRRSERVRQNEQNCTIIRTNSSMIAANFEARDGC